MLADAAQIDQQSKVHALGINWTHMPSPPLAMAIVAFVELPGDTVPAALSMTIELRDEANNPVELPIDPNGTSRPFRVETVATAESNGEPTWEPARVPFVAQVGPGLPLPPGNYRFAIAVSRAGGETVTDELRFRIRDDSVRT